MTINASRHAQLEPIETASTDELQALQLHRLKWSLRHTYENVAHFRLRCDAMGVHPEQLRKLEDLSRFPFTTKQDLRDHYPFGLFAVPRDKVARLHASSGTTGKPTIVGYTSQDLENWAILVARSIRAAGGRAGDRVQIAYGYGLFTGGLGAHYGAEKLGCTVIPISSGQTEKQVQLICDLKPDIIMATPSYILVIAEEFAQQGLDARRTSLRAGILGAEPRGEGMRSQIESAMRIDALDIYGLSEVMGPGVASECVESKDGPVIWEDHFYPEVIDPLSAAPVRDGALGELVLTSLTKEALPVIRYRTRDLTRLLAPTARCMRRIQKISDRSDDMLIIRGVNVFPSQLEELIIKISPFLPHYLLEVDRIGNLDSLTVHVEVAAGADASACQAAATRLAHLAKAHIGVNIDVKIGALGSLTRSLGKVRRVLDKRKCN
jgi:phenylacetate-CoA ligase